MYGLAACPNQANASLDGCNYDWNNQAAPPAGITCSKSPQYPNLVFQNGFWYCTDGTILASPTANPIPFMTQAKCFVKYTPPEALALLAGGIAAVLFAPGAWKLLILPAAAGALAVSIGCSGGL